MSTPFIERDPTEHITELVHDCMKCGAKYGHSAVGVGFKNKPKVFMVGMNPHVEDPHKFVLGKGITELFRRLRDLDFSSYYFDNVIKCQMPLGVKPDLSHAHKCQWYLMEQIRFIAPQNILLFGVAPALWLDVAFRKFHQTDPIQGIPTFSAPHFSSIYYYNDEAEVEKYYKRLKILLEELK
jgi:uracil-DNA glycosylase family 4